MILTGNPREEHFRTVRDICSSQVWDMFVPTKIDLDSARVSRDTRSMVRFPHSDDVARPSRFHTRWRFVHEGLYECFGMGRMLVNRRPSKGSGMAMHGITEHQGSGCDAGRSPSRIWILMRRRPSSAYHAATHYCSNNEETSLTTISLPIPYMKSYEIHRPTSIPLVESNISLRTVKWCYCGRSTSVHTAGLQSCR